MSAQVIIRFMKEKKLIVNCVTLSRVNESFLIIQKQICKKTAFFYIFNLGFFYNNLPTVNITWVYIGKKKPHYLPDFLSSKYNIIPTYILYYKSSLVVKIIYLIYNLSSDSIIQYVIYKDNMLKSV